MVFAARKIHALTHNMRLPPFMFEPLIFLCPDGSDRLSKCGNAVSRLF